jgi:hypothetical protein
MPVEPRPPDQFTRDHLLLGFSTVEFEPELTGGGFGPAVELGILSSEALQKEVEILELERGDAGTLTVDREIVSKLKPSFSVETFNMRQDVAQYVFGSDITTPVVADATAAVTDDPVTAPTGADALRTFLSLSQADVAAGSFTVNGDQITAETVTNVTGDGTTLGDYQLQYKLGALGDLTLLRELTAAGVLVRTFVPQAGAPTSELEAQVQVGVAADSGEMDLFQAVAAGNTIEATYNPTLDGVEDDNSAATADYVIDPLLGRILFRRLDTFASPDAASAFREGQPVLADYTYSRKASTTLQPFRQPSFEGRVTIRHLTDVGVNFVWVIPSATIRLTDDDLTFGADDFATASLILNINDAGGTQRFGTLQLSSEPEAAA